MSEIKLFNIDCLNYMKTIPNKHFDLSIIDPPYGIDVINKTFQNKKLKPGKSCANKTIFKIKKWDNNKPDKKYFQELFRVSKNQIIFGANHFISRIPFDSSCWIVWDKNNGKNDFADCELAWTSFDSAVRIFKYKWHGMLQEDMKNKQKRIHPTEKSIALYKWLLKNYAKKGDKIFDSHGGSGSILIAAYDMKFDLDWCEKDFDYFKAAKHRFEIHKQQLKLF